MELLLQGPALEEGEDETGVEGVACAGGVDGVDAEGGGIVELGSIPCEDAFVSKSGCGEAAPEATSS